MASDWIVHSMKTTRYERLVMGRARRGHPYEAAIASASHEARNAHTPHTTREMAIRDVAAGVAAPTLVGFVVWALQEADRRGVQRLRFLSRDGQIMHRIAMQLAPRLGYCFDMEYVYSSRLTWSLAASDPFQLSKSEWLFNSFMKSNAFDVCARLGLDIHELRPLLVAKGVNLSDNSRADSVDQLRALQSFVDQPEVAERMEDRVSEMHDLVANYADQQQLIEPDTALVDSGWTGRMVGSLIKTTGDQTRPHVLLWGHEPRESGWTDNQRVAAFMYNSARDEGMDLRVPDAPFLVETFCMADHGVVAGYEYDRYGTVRAILQSEENEVASDWGIRIYRSTIDAFCDAFDITQGVDLRVVISQLMHEFWLHPSKDEAAAWGQYIYDSDPASSAARTLARPISIREIFSAGVDRGDRAWLPGSIEMSSLPVKLFYGWIRKGGSLGGHPTED